MFKRVESLGWRAHVFIVLAAFALLISRRPDAITNPVFFAEDGSIWYPQAYTLGWLSALLHPQDGYFQTLPRLAAALALVVRFRYAPLFENVLALGFQVLPVSFLLSQRCRNWGSLPLRAILAFVYIALPNSTEVHGSMEEAQWHLAVLACLIVLADEPVTRAWRIFDGLALIIFGLSGPFVVMLLPLAVIYWWFRRQRWTAVLCLLLGVCAAVQVSALIGSTVVDRPKMMRDASAELFTRLLGGHVYMAALFGQYAYWHRKFWMLVVAALFGTAVLVYCFLKAKIEWRLLLLFCALIFTAGLIFPMVAAPQWPVLDTCPGIRYWYIPTVGFAWAVVWAAFHTRPARMQWVAIAVLISMVVGIWRDWRYKPFDDVGFRYYARWFMAAPPGIMVLVPILPGGWFMRIAKRVPACEDMPQGSIMVPGPYAHVGSGLTLKGTLAARSRAQKLMFSVDRKLQSEVALPQSKWAQEIDLTNFSPGVHEIEVRARRDSTCEADIGIAPVIVSR